ncbi:MAG: hypothetical protein AAGE94_22500 [Acidobacteriota bacterium]
MVCPLPSRLGLVGALVTCLFLGCGGGEPTTNESANEPPAAAAPTPAEDEAAVRAAFEEYRAALLSADGARAARAVDRPTIDWYQGTIDKARSIDRGGLDELTIMEKFTVLRLRHEFDRAALDAMTGESLFALAVENEWVNRTSVERVELARITLDGDAASASINTDLETPLFYFSRRRDDWGFALWRTFPVADESLAQLIVDHGITVDQFVVSSLETLTNSPVDLAIYDGPPS